MVALLLSYDILMLSPSTVAATYEERMESFTQAFDASGVSLARANHVT